MLKIFNAEAFASAQLYLVPFKWAKAVNIFQTPQTARCIAESFPVKVLQMKQKKCATTKSYKMLTKVLVENNLRTSDVKGLSQNWIQMLDDLESEEFRDAITRLTNVDLSHSYLEVRAALYEAGCFIDPHTDRSDKKVTLICYLESNWQADFGGQLNILGSCSPHDVVSSILPLLDTAAAIVPSEHSWHSVTPVSKKISNKNRRSILIHFSRRSP
jgi:SM-20-related protein